MTNQSLREGLTDLKDGLIAEWHRRTWYGKLWYPVWFLKFQLILVFSAFLALAMAFERGLNKEHEPVREVYKDDE